MSILSIDELKGIINNRDIAKGNRFRFEVFADNLNIVRDLSLLCQRINMPGKQLLSTDRRVGLSFQKIAYGYASEDVNVSFLLTGDMYAKDVFEAWQQSAVMSDEQFDFHVPRFKNEYTHDSRITAIDKNGNDIYRIILVDSYPTTVNPIEYSNEHEGILQLDIQLSYKRWYKEEI